MGTYLITKPDGSKYKVTRPPSVAEDITDTVPAAVARIPFVVGGVVGDLMGLGMETGRWIDENILGNQVKSREEVAAANPLANITSGALEKSYEGIAGTDIYDSQTDPGRMVGAAVTGAGGGLLVGGVSGAVMGAGGGAGGEFARQKTAGTKAELPVSILGAVGGAAAGGGAMAAARRVVTPRNIPPENAAAARVLRREGIGDLTEGQVTQSKKLQAAERGRMGIRGDARRIDQAERFTAAMLRRIGSNATRATPEVLAAERARIGGDIQTVANRNALQLDRQFGTDLNGTLSNYARLVSEPNRAPGIRDAAQEILNHARQGPIPGDVYQSLRSRLAADARATTEPHARRTLNALVHDLDDAMERSIQRTNPSDLGRFRTARNQYRNLLVVEDAATVAGSDAALGLLSPAASRSAARRIHGRQNMAAGRGDFEELTRAGSALLTELPFTGAAPFNTATGVFSAAKTGAGLVRMLPSVQRYLTNRMLPPPAGNPVSRSLLPAVPGATMATQGPYRTGGGF